jgi:hypothetical protein
VSPVIAGSLQPELLPPYVSFPIDSDNGLSYQRRSALEAPLVPSKWQSIKTKCPTIYVFNQRRYSIQGADEALVKLNGGHYDRSQYG